MSRITTRCNETLKEEFKDHCEKNGTNMSERVKTLIKEDIGEVQRGNLPDDEELAAAYRTMFWTTAGDHVEVDDAESAIANALNIPKTAVRARIIRPLRDRGYVTLKPKLHRVCYRLNVPIEIEEDHD